jgi:hypothetical protein
MQSLGLIASTPALGRTKMLGERRSRRMQVSQMLKATFFMFWFKLEGTLPSIFFPPLLAVHFKKWACVDPYNYNLFFPLLHGNECPIPKKN